MNLRKAKNRAFTVTIILISVLSLYACSDFLNQPVQGTLDQSVLNEPQGVEGSLLAAYAVLDGSDSRIGPNWTAAGNNWVMGEVVSDNAYKGSESGDQQGMQDLELFDWSLSTADQVQNDRWIMLYEGVSRANTVLTQLEQVEGLSESDEERIRGEALALRAHYHFEAYKLWENVPYVTEDDEDVDVPNTEPVLPQVLTDLDNAINLLPPTQEDVGRITEWVAKSLKGRILMFDQQFDEALTTLQDVVNNGPYELEDNYWDVFSATNNNGSETILAYQASVNDGAEGANGNAGDALSFPHSGSPFSCCGFFQPSQNLVNAFQINDNGLPLPVTQPDNWNTLDDNPDSDVPVDPRLDWTVGRNGVPFLDWGIHEMAWIRDPDFGGIYSTKKHIWEEGSGAESDVSSRANWKNNHLLRYADIILMLAEAHVEVGSTDRALELVNQIRRRAAQAAQGPTDNIEVPIDDSSITWANYQIEEYQSGAFSDRDFARRAVRIERRLELAQEGHRLFDLRRWDRDQEVLRNYLEEEQTRRSYLQNAASIDERHDRYPIPQQQIDLTTELEQNSGW